MKCQEINGKRFDIKEACPPSMTNSIQMLEKVGEGDGGG